MGKKKKYSDQNVIKFNKSKQIDMFLINVLMQRRDFNIEILSFMEIPKRERIDFALNI